MRLGMSLGFFYITYDTVHLPVASCSLLFLVFSFPCVISYPPPSCAFFFVFVFSYFRSCSCPCSCLQLAAVGPQVQKLSLFFQTFSSPDFVTLLIHSSTLHLPLRACPWPLSRVIMRVLIVSVRVYESEVRKYIKSFRAPLRKKG